MLSVEQTARLTGGSTAWVRSACARGILGDRYCNGKGERFRYMVSEGKVAEWLGISAEELEKRVKDV